MKQKITTIWAHNCEPSYQPILKFKTLDKSKSWFLDSLPICIYSCYVPNHWGWCCTYISTECEAQFCEGELVAKAKQIWINLERSQFEWPLYSGLFQSKLFMYQPSLFLLWDLDSIGGDQIAKSLELMPRHTSGKAEHWCTLALICQSAHWIVGKHWQ